MQAAWKAYYGQYKDSLKVEGDFDDNVKDNPAKFIVNTGTNYLFGQAGPTWAAVQEDTTAKDAPPPWKVQLDQLWKLNRKTTTLLRLGINGGVCGHVFVKLLPTGTGPDRSSPRIVVLDPANVCAIWDPQDVDTVVEYRIQYVTADAQGAYAYRQRIIRSDDGLTWNIVDEKQSSLLGYWQRQGSTPWPYSWPPIVDCQNLVDPNAYYGISDLDVDTLNMIRLIQYTDSNMSKIIRIHAHPKTVVSGMTSDATSEIDVSPDGMITLPDPDATLKLLEMISDLGASQKFAERLEAAMAEVTMLPRITRGTSDQLSSGMSGVNMSILYAPAVTKTEMKQSTYGDMLLELNRRLLVLSNFAEDPWSLDMGITWPEILPGSQFLERQTLLVDKQLGVSRKTIIEKLGYDPVVEESNNATDAQKQLDQQKELALATHAAPGINANPVGSMGGTRSAGTTKTPQQQQRSVPPTNASTGK